jgi:hypothetical protein
MDIDKVAFTGSTAVGRTIIKTLDPDSLETLVRTHIRIRIPCFFLYIFALFS